MRKITERFPLSQQDFGATLRTALAFNECGEWPGFEVGSIFGVPDAPH
jgi:hypothetical protein